MDILEFVQDNYYIVAPVLYVIGYTIKHTELIKDKFIPIIMIVLGVVFAVGIGGINVESIIQGILVAGLPVLGHETFKQLSKNNK